MSKVSKKDQDPKQTDTDRDKLAKFLAKKSPHFTVGTGIIQDNVRGTVMVNNKQSMLIAWEDGIVSTVTPINPLCL